MGKQIGQSVNSATRTTLSFIPGMKFCFLSSAHSQLSTINTQLLRNHYHARSLPAGANSCVRRGITDASYPPVDEKPPTP
jgi:hypothetical protein